MNIISSILILVLERTRLIGVLKSIGCLNWSIRKIFIYNAMYFVFRGLLWGNLIAFFLLFIQFLNKQLLQNTKNERRKCFLRFKKICRH